MTIQITLTERLHDLLTASVQKVRGFSQRQAAERWWIGDLANARRALRKLEDVDLLFSAEVLVRPILQLDGPIFKWKPGDKSPNCGQMAHLCQSRIRRIPVRMTRYFVATERAARLFGGRCRGKLTHPAQATHDLGVTAVWLHLSRICPEMATGWLGEDMLSHTRQGQKCPDAFIVDSHGTVSSVVEFCGDYDRERIQSFHEDCVERGLPYQMW